MRLNTMLEFSVGKNNVGSPNLGHIVGRQTNFELAIEQIYGP